MTAALEQAKPEERCDCCELPLSSCGREAERRQRAAAAAERTRLLSLSGWWPAQYAGTCLGCGERFVDGDPIRRAPSSLTGSASGYVAGCCGSGDR